MERGNSRRDKCGEYKVRIRRTVLPFLSRGKKVKESQKRVCKLKAAEAQDAGASLIPVSTETPYWLSQGLILVSRKRLRADQARGMGQGE